MPGVRFAVVGVRYYDGSRFGSCVIVPFQQIAAGCQVVEFKTFDQVLSVLIDQCLKRYNIEFAIGADENVAVSRQELAPDWLHHGLIEQAPDFLIVLGVRVSDGTPKLPNQLINLQPRSQVDKPGAAAARQAVGHVPPLTPFASGFVTCIRDNLDQCRVRRNSHLNFAEAQVGRTGEWRAAA